MAPALELADILRAYTPTFLEAYSETTSPEQRRVLQDLVRCRTAALGGARSRLPSRSRFKA